MSTVDLIFEYFEIATTLFMYGWPFMLLIVMGVWYMLWKKWPVDVVIFEKRGNNLIKTNDRAGRITDRITGLTYYRLQKYGDNIPIPDYDWVMHNNPKPSTILEKFVSKLRGNLGTIFLYRYGSKQYKPIKVSIAEGESEIKLQEVKDAEGNPIYVTVYQPLDPKRVLQDLKFETIDWDDMNFMVQEQRTSIERRKKSGEYWKQVIIPAAMIAGSALVCVIMFKFSFDWATQMWSRGDNIAPATHQPATVPQVPVISNVIPAPGT